MSDLERLGVYLAAERNARAVTLEELAATTRIPAKMLRALESEDWSVLPGEVFVKGYLRSIARVLGVPENQLFCRMSEGRAPSTPPPLPVTLGRNTGSRNVGVALALVVLVVLFTFALSMITEPRYRSAPVRLSALENVAAQQG